MFQQQKVHYHMIVHVIVHLEMNYHSELSFLSKSKMNYQYELSFFKKPQMIVQNDSSFWKKVHSELSLSPSSLNFFSDNDLNGTLVGTFNLREIICLEVINRED